MHDVVIPLGAAAIRPLDTAMRAEFGSAISGISYGNGTARVHFYDPPSATAQLQAQAIVEAHDPAIITATRDGDVVTIVVNKPLNLDDATQVTLTCDGAEITATLGVPIQIADEVGDTQPMTLSISDYPCDTVEV